MFYVSYVEPYICYERGYCDLYGIVKYYKDGKFDHCGDRIYIGRIYDDDYIDEEAVCEKMFGKTIYEVGKILEEAYM